VARTVSAGMMSCEQMTKMHFQQTQNGRNKKYAASVIQNILVLMQCRVLLTQLEKNGDNSGP